MQTFRSVIFRLFKAEAGGCSVSRLTRCTSYYHPRQPVLRQTAAGGPRTSNRQTVHKTRWSSTERRLDSATLCPHSGHRMPLHTPTNVPGAFFFFCTVNTPENADPLSASDTGRQHGLCTFGYDHINCNPPVLIRTPKLTQFEPAQYWGGGPPGNSAVLYPFLPFYYLL
jgi:hypothetical protein